MKSNSKRPTVRPSKVYMIYFFYRFGPGREAELILANGSSYSGYSFGAHRSVGGEVVFNRSVPWGCDPFQRCGTTHG